MRIVRLELRAYGPFTGEVLDFSAGRHGLHIVHGPNEAGKSTTLRAIQHALYGIPAQTDDSFLHVYSALRIGATLEASDGTRLSFVRRKGNRNTLRDAEDDQPLEDLALRPFLGTQSVEEFQSRFGIDHRRLRQGGVDLLGSDGRVGKALFAAGSGMGGVRSVLKKIDAELEKLFKPQGSNPSINKNLSELKKAEAELKRVSLPCEEWLAHHNKLQRARSELKSVEEELRRLGAELTRLGDLELSLPLIAERAQAIRRREELGRLVLLPDGFADRRLEAVASRATALDRLQRAEASIEQLERKLRGESTPDPLIESGPSIERLRGELQAVRNGEADRPRLLAELKQADARTTELLADLRPGAGSEGFEPPRISSRRRRRIQELGSRYQSLREQKQAILAEFERLNDQIEVRPSPPSDPEMERLAQRLGAAIRIAREQGDLATVLRKLESDRESAAQSAQIERDALGLGPIDLADLERLTVPSIETIERFEADLGGAAQERSAILSRLNEARAAFDSASRIAQDVCQKGELPAESDLTAARSDRERIWIELRTAWLDETPLPTSGRTALARNLESGTERADRIADQLRREAERVAALASARAEREAAGLKIEQLEEQRALVDERLAGLKGDWHACWSSLGREPLSPREMRGWSLRFRGLLQSCTTWRGLGREIEGVSARIAALRSDLTRDLAPLDPTGPNREASLRTLLDHAQVVVDRITAASDRWRARESARLQARRAVARLARWRARWKRAIAPLGIGEKASPDQAYATLIQLDDLRAQSERAMALRRGLSALDEQVRRFQAAVATLAEQVAPDLQGGRPESVVEELDSRLQSARLSRARIEGLERQLEEQRKLSEESRAALVGVEARIDELCREAGCDGLEGLPEAERRSEEARRIDNEVRTLEQQLIRLAGPEDLASFLERATTIDREALALQVRELSERIEERKRQAGALNQTIGSEENELSRMDGNDRAGQQAEEVESLRARLTAEAETYARLKLASRMLRDAIEVYRQKNQGPLLERASELFRMLTAGSFDGLCVVYDDEKDEPLLKGSRTVGAKAEEVGISGMSEGTADQLYLALRLASLEAHVQNHEPIPFIVDDILIQCDDARAGAALEALADLSRRTQVLFFTHHEHLVRLAEDRLHPSTLFVHRLGRAVVGNGRHRA